MPVNASLSQDTIQVEPGARQPLGLTVTNPGQEEDTYEIIVEGLDPEWCAVPNPSFSLAPGESKSEKIFLRPIRASENMAGMYPFTVRVRSLTDGESVTLEATMDILAFHHISVDITPKKALLTPSRRSAEFAVTVMNLGNSDHEVMITASDADDSCEFELETNVVTIGAGHEKIVPLQVRSTRGALLANSRLHGFQVTSRSRTLPNLSSTVNAQLEQRAFLSPGAFFVVLMVLGLIGAWILSFPKPPMVEDIVLSSSKVETGQTVSVDWRTVNAEKVEFKLNGVKYSFSVDKRGRLEIPTMVAGEYTLEAIAKSGNRTSEGRTVSFSVVDPPPVPDPSILAFRANRTSANVGEVVILSYTVNDAVTRLLLEPKQLEVDPTIRSGQIEVPITQEGSNEFVLTAYNAKQETVRQTVTVKGIKGSKARVISARVTPSALESEGGTAVLEWQVTNAVRIELVIDGVTQVLSGATGTLDLPITKTTKLKLVAYDDEGLTLARDFVVTVKPPANPQGRTPEDNGPPQPKQNPPLDGGTKTDPPSSGERP